MSSRYRLSIRRGVTAIEYGIIAGLIIVAILVAVALTGTNLKAVFGQVSGTLENVAAPASVYAFGGAFETITTQSLVDSGCAGQQVSGFASSAPGGGLLNPNACGPLSQSIAYTDLTSNTATGAQAYYAYISNQATGQPIVVPPLQGAGTGFTLPASAGVNYVQFYKTQSGSGYSFFIEDPSGLLNSNNIASAQSACAAESGVLYYRSNYAQCGGGYLYTGTEIATMLPPQ